jgi:hypothetical protein
MLIDERSYLTHYHHHHHQQQHKNNNAYSNTLMAILSSIHKGTLYVQQVENEIVSVAYWISWWIKATDSRRNAGKESNQNFTQGHFGYATS